MSLEPYEQAGVLLFSISGFHAGIAVPAPCQPTLSAKHQPAHFIDGMPAVRWHS